MGFIQSMSRNLNIWGMFGMNQIQMEHSIYSWKMVSGRRVAVFLRSLVNQSVGRLRKRSTGAVKNCLRRKRVLGLGLCRWNTSDAW